MPDDNITPEERLFRAIQQDKKPAVPETIGQPGQAPYNPKGISTGQGSLFQRIRQILAKGKKKAGAGQSLFASPPLGAFKQLLTNGVDLDAVNRASTLALMALVVYAVVVATAQRPSIDRLREAVSKIRFEASPSGAMEAFQPIDYYLGQVRGRDIFNVHKEVEQQVREEPLAPPPEPPAPQPRLKDMITGLKVVGIAWGEAPKAMIQDDTAQSIYFLKKGDRIGKTEIRIKDILRNKVIIGYEQEEMEL